MNRPCCALALAMLVLPTATATAQTLVTVRVVGDRPPDIAAVADRVPVSLNRVAAREAFETSHSAPAAVLDDDVLQAWVQAAEGALELVGLGDARGAVRELQRVGQFSASAVESLNRTASHREVVLNTCLLLVRSLLATERDDEARAQVHECLRLSPMTQPAERSHPPQVLTLLAEVAQEVRQQNAMLRVRSVGRQGCTVRINGVRVNTTPAELVHFPEGGEYRVQVECDQRRGRVHRVILRGEAEVVVDPRFEETVTTDADGGLVLEYQSMQSARRYAVEDGLTIARTLGTEVVLAVSDSGGVGLVGVREEGDRAVVWRSTLDDFDWEEAHEDETDVATAPPADGPSAPAATPPAPRRPSASGWNWALVGGLGAVGVGLGIPALFEKLNEGERIGCDDTGTCTGFRAFRRNVWLPLGIVSAASVVSAVVIGIVQPIRRPHVEVTLGRGEFQLHYSGSF